eukprot:TRINITY_DN1564_c0_g1_i2.p1 TRINITY_DN1564_c0_g1~~TRINITY_DN1564_c0_g1_i2.p1  ORF type:complete len:816 (-),score=299.92 TRINITY_DN1564_c0_g1_i2:473-2893(-)
MYTLLPAAIMASGFALAQLAKSVLWAATAAAAAAGAGRVPASVELDQVIMKADKWREVIEQMRSGQLQVGSRVPVTGTPAWATLEVLHGGFASGKLLAALRPEDTPNASYLTSDGAVRLAEQLITGKYRIKVPEHGALLVLVWLLQAGRLTEAQDLLQTVEPFFDRVRFYPDASDAPLDTSPLISVGTVQDVVAVLDKLVLSESDITNKRAKASVLTANALQHWIPLKWRLADLFLETLECEHTPAFQVGPDGKPLRDGRRHLFVQHAHCPKHTQHGCGWPLQRFSDDWHARAANVLAAYTEALATPHADLSKGKLRPGSSLDVMLTCLRTCVEQGHEHLTGMQVGRLRATLAGLAARSGAPHHAQHALYISAVANAAERSRLMPRAADFKATLTERLGGYDPERGVADVAPLLAPVHARGIERPLPNGVARAVRRAQLGTLPQLAERGHITSAESIASVIKPLVAEASSAGLGGDPAARRLAYALRRAFYDRRSLLLTDLQSQVRLAELPWVAPLLQQPQQQPGSANFKLKSPAQEAALATLRTVTCTALSAFPHTILPNKLLQSLRELLQAAGMDDVPLTDELAADIFTGQFSRKFLVAARTAAALLHGTVYAAYYRLDDKFAALLNPAFTLQDFNSMCTSMGKQGDCSWLVRHGRVIESQQLLTTHNLATVFSTFAVGDQVDCATLAVKTWDWILRALERGDHMSDWKPRLQLSKDIAYAWRQLIFFLSRVSSRAEVDAVLLAMENLALSDAIKASKETRVHATTTFLEPLKHAVASVRHRACEPVLGWVAGEQRSALRPRDP